MEGFFLSHPPPLCFSCYQGKEEKRRKKTFQSEQETGSKISQGASKQMCGLHLGELVFVYCLF